MNKDTDTRMTTGLFSSRTEEWETPQYVFDTLNNEFHFTLDVCATHENTKCKRFFTKEENGLAMSWSGSVFMNPPYGREIYKWMQKAYSQIQFANHIVCLVPARTDTRWWHDWAMKADEIRLIKGRLKFGDGKQSAPFPSCVVIFKPTTKLSPTFKSVIIK